MTREELINDVAYARALAEEGRRAPLLGGGYLMFWGALNAVSFTAHWAILTGLAPSAGGLAFGLLWMSYGLAAAIGMAVLRTRGRHKPGLGSIGSRAEQAVWAGAAIAIGAVVLGSLARMFADHDATAPNAIFGAAFALYGAALFGVARLSGYTWLSGFASLSVGFAALLCLFANQPWAYLVAAAGSLLVLAAPGIVLLRREPPALP